MSFRDRRVVFSIALLAMHLAATPSARALPPPRPTRVLLIYGPAPDSPTADSFVQAFRRAMRNELQQPVEFYEEYLDLDRFPGPARGPQLARYFADKYSRFPVDVVVSVGSDALRFAIEHVRAFAPNKPVVFGMTLAQGVDVSALPANFTGHMMPMPLAATVAMARRLQRDADRIVVIAGASPVDSVVAEAALRDIAPHRDGLRLELRRGGSFEALLADLRKLSPRAIVVFAYFRRDGDGKLFEPLEVTSAIARASRAPVYGWFDQLLGTGITGGALVRLNEEAASTARLAVRVLRARGAEALPPVEIASTPLMADWRALRRFGLDERRLPARTEIRFREPTVWERFRVQILIAAGVFAAQALLIALLLVERRRRILAQRELEEQRAYERMIGDLTTDAARLAPEESSKALQDALERIGRFAGASVAMLQEEGDANRSIVREKWSAIGAGANVVRANGAGARLAIPLLSGMKRIGTLELHRPRDAGEWPARLVQEIGLAAELIAGAMARSREHSLAQFRAEENKRQIAHMGRLAMVGELAAAVAHDLHQPLTAIRLNAETGATLLANDPTVLGELREIFGDIVRDDARAARVIERIRALLRKEAPRNEVVDVNEVCRQAVRILQHDAELRSTHITLELSAAPAQVSGDAIQLQQVVLNLTLNAVDAAAAGDRKRQVVVATAIRGEHVEICVHDSGRGLPPEIHKFLFDAFFTTKPHGLGMGLAIVRSIVERHQGRIRANNAPSGGALFRVHLPLHAARPAAPAARRNGTSEGQGGAGFRLPRGAVH